MIGYVMVGTNNLSKSITFYDALLDLLSLKRVDTTDDYAGYASKNNPENIEFYITKPVNGVKFKNAKESNIVDSEYLKCFNKK